jgi:hypothetical protein
VAQPHEPPRHELVLEVERILMVDFTTTKLGSRERLPPPTMRGGGQTEAVVAKPPNASPPPTVDGVDRLYR